MFKYTAYWGANNSTYHPGTLFTNKREAAKWARECALGNVFAGNKCWWKVCNADGDIVKYGVKYMKEVTK